MCSRTPHTATVPDKVAHSVTILDPAHPFYGRSFPLVRGTTSRGRSDLVLRLPDGSTRSVPRAATNWATTPTPSAAAAGLLPVSVRTLLSVARRLRSMALAQEESSHVSPLRSAPGHAAPTAGSGTDTVSGPTRPALASPRSAAPSSLCSASGSSASSPADRVRDPQPGGAA